MTAKAFVVCLDEIRQNFAFGDCFAGSYAKSVTMSDGPTRKITLTPMVRDGKDVVELEVNGHISYMGPHSTTTLGTLMVQVREIPADTREELEARGFLKPG